MMTAVTFARRRTLDELMLRLRDPGFVSLYRRVPSARESSGHVSPSVLAHVPSKSRYVRRWRRHARRCPQCAEVFRFLGLSLK
jgi:hypothetical protein